ncbi:MAG: hypothetical protein SCALA702_07710 [Melioribacteraceae bacterium]|nr:MAG: hypothetical protein SCALA702_07710 [Melioribacteraceae bacterium]
MKDKFRHFVQEFENEVTDLSKEATLAYFDASISGKEDDFRRASELQHKLSLLFADKEKFEELKIYKDYDFGDPVLNRQAERLYNEFAGTQFNPELLEKIIKLSATVEEQFSVFRAEVDGVKYTDNQIDDVLQDSEDSEQLQKFWEASKQIGAVVKDDVIKLVKMRNEAARELGFENHHTMSLTLSEQDPAELDRLFDELDKLTRDEFAKLKSEIDNFLSKKYNAPVDDLMPWHYQDKFFQQGPKIYSVDLDRYYMNEDIVKLTRDYYNGLGMNIDDLLEKSDLFEKEGKYQHAYCTDIDRSGDVRVVCNVKPNYRWTGTMLHEYGHAVYDKYVNKDLPWILREHSHIFTTEAIAMLFGRMAANPDWIKDMTGISEEEKNEIASDCFNSLKLEQLTFSRWVQVIYRFERAMYAYPDLDLNALWWELVEKYQMLKKPAGRNAPDWAAKIHISLYPAYYHNYILGELTASQLHSYIMKNYVNGGSTSLVNNKNAGKFLMDKFFYPGALLHWSELIKSSTGEELTPKYYAEQFVHN